MKKKIDNMISQSFEDMAPDIFEKIKDAPYEKFENEEGLFGLNEKGDVISFEKAQKNSKKRRTAWGGGLVAAAIAICLIGTNTIGEPSYAGEIRIESDYGVVLKIDDNDQVKDVEAIDEESEPVAKMVKEKMNFPAKVEDAVTTTVATLDENKKDKNSKEGVRVTYTYKEHESANIDNSIGKVTSDENHEIIFQKGTENKGMIEKTKEPVKEKTGKTTSTQVKEAKPKVEDVAKEKPQEKPKVVDKTKAEKKLQHKFAEAKDQVKEAKKKFMMAKKAFQEGKKTLEKGSPELKALYDAKENAKVEFQKAKRRANILKKKLNKLSKNNQETQEQ